MQPDADRTERLTVGQAAERLGISAEAVRQRIKRDTLHHVKDAGTVYVLFDRHDDDRTTDQALIVARLDSEVAYLRQQLDQANERDRENRRIIAGLTQRIPELEAPRSPVEHLEDEEALREEAGMETRTDEQRQRWHEYRHGVPRESSESTGPTRTPTDAGEGPAQGVRRPWWRRVFGG